MSIVPFPDKAACRFCGDHHRGEWCPLIEAIEYDPDTQTITRIEFRAIEVDDE